VWGGISLSYGVADFLSIDFKAPQLRYMSTSPRIRFEVPSVFRTLMSGVPKTSSGRRFNGLVNGQAESVERL